MRQTTVSGRAGRALGAIIGGLIGIGIALLWLGLSGAGGLESYANTVVVVLMLAGIVIGYYVGQAVGRSVHRRISDG